MSEPLIIPIQIVFNPSDAGSRRPVLRLAIHTKVAPALVKKGDCCRISLPTAIVVVVHDEEDEARAIAALKKRFEKPAEDQNDAQPRRLPDDAVLH